MATSTKLAGPEIQFNDSSGATFHTITSNASGILLEAAEGGATGLSGIADPETDDAAANKAYVDSKFSNGISSTDISTSISGESNSLNLVYENDKIHLGQTISGLTKISAATVVSTSDAKLKCDVKTIDPAEAMCIVKRLRPVHFKFKDSKHAGRTGFIAQEVQKIVPELVGISKTTSMEQHLTVNYIDAIAYLFAAVQQLDAKIREKEPIIKQPDQSHSDVQLQPEVQLRTGRD